MSDPATESSGLVRSPVLLAALLAGAAAGIALRSAPAALAGFAAGALVGVAVARAREAWRRRLAAAVAAESDPGRVAPRLEHPGEVVRLAAATRLAALEGADALARRLGALATDERTLTAAEALARALGRDLVKRDAATRVLVAAIERESSERVFAPGEVLAALGPEPALVREALARATDVERQLALAGAIAGSGEGARALVAVAAEEAIEPEARQRALERLEAAPRETAAAAAREALVGKGEPTPELVWALGLSGEPGDAALAARFVAAPSFPLADAALAAVEELRGRGAPSDPGPLRAALAAGREALRAVHPPGDNRLADELVGRIEALEARERGA